LSRDVDCIIMQFPREVEQSAAQIAFSNLFV
jgi:hypothetical protein